MTNYKWFGPPRNRFRSCYNRRMPSDGSTRRTSRPARAKPARGLRFHLITWIVMVLVASVFLGLNVVPQGPYMTESLIPQSRGEYSWAYFRGWPLQYLQAGETRHIPDSILSQQYLKGGELHDHPDNPLPFDASGERYLPDPSVGEIDFARFIPGKVGRLGAMFCNLLLGLSACGVIGLTVEWFARKRQGTGVRGEAGMKAEG